MASAFDNLQPSDAQYVRERLLAGDSMAEIRRGMDITLKAMREMRDEVFEPLINDPEAVKALASGAVLNPLDIIRYRRRPGRKTRMARAAPVQMEMWPTSPPEAA